MLGITDGVSYGREGYGGGNGAYESFYNKNFGEKRGAGYNYGSSDQVMVDWVFMVTTLMVNPH